MESGQDLPAPYLYNFPPLDTTWGTTGADESSTSWTLSPTINSFEQWLRRMFCREFHSVDYCVRPKPCWGKLLSSAKGTFWGKQEQFTLLNFAPFLTTEGSSKGNDGNIEVFWLVVQICVPNLSDLVGKRDRCSKAMDASPWVWKRVPLHSSNCVQSSLDSWAFFFF